MDYAEAVDTLKNRIARFGIVPTLENMRALAQALGDPQKQFASVQVAGTNGKTSVSRIVAACIEATGLRSGLYTSPELIKYPERIEVAGRVIADEEFARAVTQVLAIARNEFATADLGITEFDTLTAAAFWEFARRSVDVAVLEVGLGGLWDSTSVVDPAVAVITGVSLDHQSILGATTDEIAVQKAGIIKPACTPVLGPGTQETIEVFMKAAARWELVPRAVREVGAPSPVSDDLTTRYFISPTECSGKDGSRGWNVDVDSIHATYKALWCPGPRYQAPNIAIALAATEAVLGRALGEEEVRTALEHLSVPGRFEFLSEDPPLVIDGSHNPEAAQTLADEIAYEFKGKKVHIILGAFGDKDVGAIIEALAPVAESFTVAAPKNARALPVHKLAVLVENVTGVMPQAFESVAEAVAATRSTDDVTIVTGSLSMAGEAKAWFMSHGQAISS